jgi:hypothetical protein
MKFLRAIVYHTADVLYRSAEPILMKLPASIIIILMFPVFLLACLADGERSEDIL